MIMTRKSRNIKEIDGAEYGVNSKYSSRKDQRADGKALMEARLQRMQNLSEEQIMKARLIQLKLKMEDYIKQPIYEQHNFFTDFLASYIDTIYSKRSSFAKDISVTPVRLSQVLNNHREPKEEFILRLMLHSEKIFENICRFHKKTWVQVYYHEKICDTMSSQDEWRPNVEKHVKLNFDLSLS